MNRRNAAFLMGSMAGLALYACSASSSPPDQNGLFGNGGQANGSSTDASVGGGPVFGAGGNGAGPVFENGGSNQGGAQDGACPVIKEKPETVTTSKPVALFIMQDRSGSMVTGFPPPACSCSWDNATAAVTAFVHDPATAGIDIGMGEFPAGQNNTASCSDGADCGNPVVPIAPLPGNANAMIQAYQSEKPSSPIALTPTECGLRGMINQCLQFMASSPTGEQCVAILVTDGTPTQCDTNQQNLLQVVADGHAKGVTTYTLGLQGADINALNAIAQAGGSNAALDVSGGAAQFIAALNNIRQTVVVTSPLPCQWKIPSTGPTFDKTKVNVQFVPPGGGPPVQFGAVPTAADCAKTNGDAWYYDNNDNPTEVLVCPNTCSGTMHNAAGAEVDILFGCATHFLLH